MDKGIIYYTHNGTVDPPVIPTVREHILRSGLPITSVSLKPIDFGRNFVLADRNRGAYTLLLQIILALEKSKNDYVFFCEHDVLYHKSHFDFVPAEDDVHYYNTNNWRWRYHTEDVMTCDNLVSTSGLCCNREFALNHFKVKKGVIETRPDFDLRSTHETGWARDIGFEPGWKKRPYLPDEKFELWRSEFPNVDIRHRFCFTNRKTRPDEYAKVPTGWVGGNIDDIPGWNLREMFEGFLTV